MPTSLPPDEPANPGHVSLTTPRAIAYWTHALACSEADLRAAVATRGARPADVHHFLVRRRLARYPFLTPVGTR